MADEERTTPFPDIIHPAKGFDFQKKGAWSKNFLRFAREHVCRTNIQKLATPLFDVVRLLIRERLVVSSPLYALRSLHSEGSKANCLVRNGRRAMEEGTPYRDLFDRTSYWAKRRCSADEIRFREIKFAPRQALRRNNGGFSKWGSYLGTLVFRSRFVLNCCGEVIR